MVMNTLYLKLCGPKNSTSQCSMTLMVGFGLSCQSATVEIAKQHKFFSFWLLPGILYSLSESEVEDEGVCALAGAL